METDYECDICGAEGLNETDLEPRLEGFQRGYYGGTRGALVVHGHYQLASYDHGRRVPEEMAAIEIAECVALGAPISDADRAAYLGDDLPPFENFDYWEFVYETADAVANALPAGYVAFDSADAGTWTLWAMDRDAYDRALARYAAKNAGYARCLACGHEWEWDNKSCPACGGDNRQWFAAKGSENV